MAIRCELEPLLSNWWSGDEARRVQFEAGSKLGKLAYAYMIWLQVLRYLVPLGIVVVMAHALGAFG